MTDPLQPPPSSGVPAQPQKSKKPLIIGLVAGGAVLLVLLCCGVFAIIGANMEDSDAKSAGATVPTTAAATPTVTATTTAPASPPAVAQAPTTPTSTGPALIAMPNVVGKNAAVARDELLRLGFKKVEFGSQDRDSTVVLVPANWTVTKQSANAGERLPVDTLIVLTCTKMK